MTRNIPLAVGLTVLASFVLAIASVIQHGAVRAQGTSGDALSGGQLLAVLRNPRWLLGLVLGGVGAVLQMVALQFAPITVVQPIGVLAVPWTVLLAAKVQRTGIPVGVWAATALTVLGTTAFAWVAIVHATEYPVLNDDTLIIGTLAGILIALALAFAGARSKAVWSCLAWSAAAAVVYGVESGAVKAIGHYAASRPWLESATFWTLAASILAGAVLAGIWIQQGYASGPAEIVVGTLNAAGPVAGVCYGIVVLGEGAALTFGAAIAMVAFAAVAIAGVMLLSRHHPGEPTEPPEAGTPELLPAAGPVA